MERYLGTVRDTAAIDPNQHSDIGQTSSSMRRPTAPWQSLVCLVNSRHGFFCFTCSRSSHGDECTIARLSHSVWKRGTLDPEVTAPNCRVPSAWLSLALEPASVGRSTVSNSDASCHWLHRLGRFFPGSTGAAAARSRIRLRAAGLGTEIRHRLTASESNKLGHNLGLAAEPSCSSWFLLLAALSLLILN